MAERFCEFPGCENKLLARGMCGAHYSQWKSGKPLVPVSVGPIEKRFWLKVQKTETCWLWTAGKNGAGYGSIGRGPKGSGMVLAHRLSYELHYGAIPEGLVIDHICHNPACVNPEHLQAVTVKQNGENRAGNDIRSTTGVRGVTWNKNAQKWYAQLGHQGKVIFVGGFDSIEDAEAAVIAKRNELFTNNLLDRSA